MKQNKAITLIALIITIIVLLILAGVVISTLYGNDNIIKQAEKTKNVAQHAENDEQIQLSDLKNKVDRYITARGDITISEEDLNAKILKAVEDALTEETIWNIISEKVSDAISAVTDGELLWQNANPTADFAPQTITLKNANYNRVDVIYKHHKGDPNTVNNQTVTLYPGITSWLFFNFYEQNTAKFRNRTATFGTGKNSITFGAGTYNGGTSNDGIIPLYIIGYKSNVEI